MRPPASLDARYRFFQPGKRIGRYEVLRALGGGVLGQVYAVLDADLNREAALKIEFADAQLEAGMNVMDEARLLTSLQHPGVTKVWDAGRHDGRAYFVMELLDHALSDEPSGRQQTIERCVYWLHGIASALDHLHRRGVLHLDIHAQSVLLDGSGEVRLADFGLARAPGPALAHVGREAETATASHLAPEQLTAGAVGTYTDIWAIGALMYELLAGRAPFEEDPKRRAQNDVERFIADRSRPPPPPSTIRPEVPAAMDALCLSCLVADVERRERDAGAVARKLRPWLVSTAGSRVFISHAEADRNRVEREVVSVLESDGIRTWYCREDVRSASLWERAILDALEASDWFLLVMTPNSMQSEWVKDEVHWAIDHRPGRILPVMMDSCDPADFHIRLRRLQTIDLRDAQSSAKMLSALRATRQG